MRQSKFLRWLLEPEPPGLGIEFRAEEMVLARLVERRGRSELDLCLKTPIPSGLIEFSMLEPNIKEPEALARFLRQILDRAGVRGRRVALTLPDTLARVSTQSLPSVPRSRDELSELLRFRLKKLLPFDVSQARLSFQAVPGEANSFLTGVMHSEVVSQYESFLEELGFHPGVVEISTLSLLNLWSPVVARELVPQSDYFFVNLEESYFTIMLVRDREVPVLVRTLGQRASSDTGLRYDRDELVREIVPTVIFYREKLEGDALARVYYRSLRPDLDDVGDLLSEQFEVLAEPFDLHRALAVGSALAVDEGLASTVGAAAGAAIGNVA